MSKNKTLYRCRNCGHTESKWMGQCNDCKSWNSFDEEAIIKTTEKPSRSGGYSGSKNNEIITLENVKSEKKNRFTTGMKEFDRALGAGIIQGSVVLLGGDPGIGKSTLLLQMMIHLSESHKTLYISGEESAEQVSLRGHRISKDLSKLSFTSDTEIESILQTLMQFQPKVIVIDSIQTIFTNMLTSAPGSVSQIRESAAALVKYAKQTGCTVFIIGHVTKEGAIAGPRVLEHMVDTVLYFEGDPNARYRLLRVVKNRFGAINELGIFAMTTEGLKEVSNPSAIFLTGHEHAVSGSSILVSWEGSRAILIEIQSLVDNSASGHAKRVTLGLDSNRLTMLLAVISRHCDINMYDQDVFVNVVGGVKITETASDLPVILACLSSFKNKIIDNKTIVFGEIGLAGEIRPVANGEARVIAAAKQGFNRAIIPYTNRPKKNIPNMEIIALKRISEVINLL